MNHTVETYKAKGNAAFTAKLYQEALSFYIQAKTKDQLQHVRLSSKR